jgi:hypothetical protein
MVGFMEYPECHIWLSAHDGSSSIVTNYVPYMRCGIKSNTYIRFQTVYETIPTALVFDGKGNFNYCGSNWSLCLVCSKSMIKENLLNNNMVT